MARFINLLTFCALVRACAKEPNELGRRVKRDAVPLSAYPPQLSPEESIIVDSFSNASIATWSYYYTHGLHVAGTNKSMAQWTVDRWAENGFDSRLVEYNAYINYPKLQELSLSFADGTSTKFDLNEAVLAEDPTSSYPNRVPAFHGYSASGKVTAPYVYVGRGQQADFDALVDLGVELEGKIALARYGGPFRGLKVKNAQDHGMIGAVIFTDPLDDGDNTFLNGSIAYPNGPAREPTSVQRGSVQFLSTYPGDPTTPGYPSHEGVDRADISPVTPRIPSLPVSYLNAEPLLAALDGYGTAPDDFPEPRPVWTGGLAAQYFTGPNPDATITLTNEMEETYTPIWDSIGIINGTCEDEVIVIGNHRDAWIIGGAADPNSGSAVLVELSKALGTLVQTGWKPRRTIVLASWDMEEYGLVGSVEFVEEYLPWLTNAAVSYLNVDVACSGPVPEFSASPELHTLLDETMKKVIYPNIGSADLYEQQTLYDVFQNLSGEFGVLGSGSDYTAFLHNGIASVDIGATNGRKDPVYHYHSNFDSYAWMTKFGDPEFKIHVAIGQFLGLLTYHLSSDELVPFNITTWTDRLEHYYEELEYVVGNSTCCTSLNLAPLHDAIATFEGAATALSSLQAQASEGNDAATIALVNQKLKDFHRGFVSQGGLPDREFYKHAIFAPGLDTGYAATTYPGITEAIEFGENATLAEEWVEKTSKAIGVAAGVLAI